MSGEKNQKVISSESINQIIMSTKEPEYQLNYAGQDVSEHQGILNIRLTCPYCSNNTKFNTINTIISKLPLDKFTGQPRYFHTLSQCSNCNEIIYVLCEDYDFDPDYNFSYKTHFPRAIDPDYKTKLHSEISVLYSNADRSFFAQAYISTVLVCKELIKRILIEYSYQEVNLVNINNVFVKNGVYDAEEKVKSVVKALNKEYINQSDARAVFEVTELLIQYTFDD